MNRFYCLSAFLLSFALSAKGANAAAPVDFVTEIQPLFEASCVKCHAKGKSKGGFSLETRESFLKGGETGPGATPGSGKKSLIVELIASDDPDEVMPKKGKKLTDQEIAVVQRWIDEGAVWPTGISFAKPPPRNLAREVPPAITQPSVHPVDALLARYFAAKDIAWPAPVDDRTFARRAFLDATGLLPSPSRLSTFIADARPDKRAILIRELLADRRAYADHWISFWNDLLRNDYAGVGFIDGGRRQITGWLYAALAKNMTFDRMVDELIAPQPSSEGFTNGIIWRGEVPAAMRQPMQAAMAVSQVFMGINLKCASCHDSFVDDWALEDAYGMAAIFSNEPMELIHCDKATGRKAAVRFLYPDLGALPAELPREARMKRAAELMLHRENGRLSRTIVNRLWARLMGRGLVEPLDQMENEAWDSGVLNGLAEDLQAHGWDLKRTIEAIMTSTAYALPSTNPPEPEEEKAYVFRGPIIRRMAAEQFCDAVSALGDSWQPVPESFEFDFQNADLSRPFTLPKWIWTTEPSPEGGRHSVVLRTTFDVTELPEEAWATVLASQSWDLWINGKQVREMKRDGWRNGRVALMNVRSHLIQGRNAVSIRVSSHTEKQLSDEDRKKYPATAEHLNARSGAAFYLAFGAGDKRVELVTNEKWRVLRKPTGGWATTAFDDSQWPVSSILAPGAEPVDEGPGLQPLHRADYANIPVQLGPALQPIVSIIANTGGVRAGLRTADPLQLALDRPNRELVVSVRQNTPTTLQALELTNGDAFHTRLLKAAKPLEADVPAKGKTGPWIDQLWLHAFSRAATPEERQAAEDLLYTGNTKATVETVADLLWAVVTLPEFVYIR